MPEEIAEMKRQDAELESASSVPEPSQADRIEAQVMYTALMTDTLLTEEE